MFEHVEPFAGDPILSLNEDFQKDPRPHKINLSIGIYFDDAGRIPVLDSVRRAEAMVVARDGAKPYLPIEGAANFRAAGADAPVRRRPRGAREQAGGDDPVGGLERRPQGRRRLHRPLAAGQRGLGQRPELGEPPLDVRRRRPGGRIPIPYYDPATGALAFDAMCAALRKLPRKSVVLIHACCHNPTGVDLTRAQWDALIPLLAEGELLPYLDLAYQGFGDGIAEDAYAVRALAAARGKDGRPMSFVVANSFSKSMSLYGERCGALSVVCPDAAQAVNVLGQLKFTVRRNYSSPPIHGGQLVAAVLGEPALRAAWEQELGAMRERIQAMRRVLHDTLKKKMPRRDFGYFLSQRGMFSYTGLGPQQVDRLREEFAVYLVRSGRLCVAGLNTGNVEATGLAMAAVLDG